MIASAPAKPSSVPCSALCASTAGRSSPFGACSPPLESETAITMRALLREHPREMAADVAEALHRDTKPLERLVLLLRARR